MKKLIKDTIPREPNEGELRALEDEDDEDDIGHETVRSTLVGSASVDLARLGLDEIAYVRRTVVDDMPVWSIYSAMGHPLGAAPTLERAWGAIVQNDLQPVFVH